MTVFWNNGKMNINWSIDESLKKLKVDINEFDNYSLLVSYLYNMQLDHTCKGKLDDVGYDIYNCIKEIEQLNS